VVLVAFLITGYIEPVCEVDYSKLTRPQKAVSCNFKGARVRLVGNRLWIIAP
jgi:hypothetical protein